jgi:threonine-phosphate decarboxylase
MYINNEIDYMLSALNKIDNLVAFDTKVNFLLLKSKYAKASLIKERLVERGILIRDASNFKYLDDRFFRVAVKRREENKRLIEALKGILP